MRGPAFVSGQIALVNGVLDSSSIERETELSLNAIKSLVEEAGLTYEGCKQMHDLHDQPEPIRKNERRLRYFF